MAQVDIYITHKGQIYAPAVVEGITWETQRAGYPGKLVFTCVKDSSLNYAEGDAVRMDVDGKPAFYGFVFQKKRSKDGLISTTCYDQIKYLSKNKDTYVYKDKTATQLIQMIVDDFRLNGGGISDTGYVLAPKVEDNKTLLDIIQAALDETLMNTKRLYVLYDDAGKLSLKDISTMKTGVVIEAETAQDFDYTSSIDGETYNKIKLVYENEETGKRDVYISQDGENMNNWGILQYYEKIDNPTGAKEKADKLLALYDAVTRTLKISGAFGDIAVRGGSSVPVRLDLGDTIVSQYLVVERVAHTFVNGLHTMDMNLRGGNSVPDLLGLIKQAASDVVENSQPAAVMYGTVMSESPLSVLVDQKMTLTSDFLVVPEHLTDHEMDVSVKAGYGWKTKDKAGGSGESAYASHNHDIVINELKFFVHGHLKAGDKVSLLRAPGGQQFFILDRIQE